MKEEVAADGGGQGQGRWRKGCTQQVQQVIVTETMRSSTSRAPPCRKVFLYLRGRCQPFAHSLKKVLAREQSRTVPEGCCGAITSSKSGSDKTRLLAGVVFTQVRCPLHPWIPGCRCLDAVCSAELGRCLCRAVLCLPAIPSAPCSTAPCQRCLVGCGFAVMKETKA